MKTIKNSVTLLAAASLMSVLSACNLPPSPDFVDMPAGTGAPEMMQSEMMQKFEVTLASPTTAAGPLSPGVYVIHDSGMPLFKANAKDMGMGLEGIAEDGSPVMAVEKIPGAVAFNTPVGDDMPGPATPGGGRCKTDRDTSRSAAVFLAVFCLSGSVRQNPRQFEDLPTLRGRHRIIGANQLQRLLVGQNVARDLIGQRAFMKALEEEADGDIHRAGDVPQPGRRDPVHPGLVFLDLLPADAELYAQLFARQTCHQASELDFCSHTLVDMRSGFGIVHSNLPELRRYRVP